MICNSYNGTGGIHYKTNLLLDALEACLIMSNIFLEIVQDMLVKQFKIQVILATHSPSTVAYTPEENLFLMENSEILQKGKI